jgi:hypothetical protein
MYLEDEQPAKRRRIRHSVACEACKVRKSRCELVTAAGCHRCSVLRTPCSLTIIRSGIETDPAQQESLPEPSRRSSTLNGNATRGSASSRSRPASNPVSPSPGAPPLDRDQIVAAIIEIREYTARIELLSSSVMAAISAPIEPPEPAGPSRPAQQPTRPASSHSPDEIRPPTVSSPIQGTSVPSVLSQTSPTHTDPAALLHWNCQGSDDPDVADFTARAPFTQDVVKGALDR